MHTRKFWLLFLVVTVIAAIVLPVLTPLAANAGTAPIKRCGAGWTKLYTGGIWSGCIKWWNQYQHDIHCFSPYHVYPRGSGTKCRL